MFGFGVRKPQRQGFDWETSITNRLAALEDRMDRDEAVRKEWIGTVKRVIARINKANERLEHNEGEVTTSVAPPRLSVGESISVTEAKKRLQLGS